jgi:hypothetical protein
MSDYRAIADVGIMLIRLLRNVICGEMPLISGESIVLASPGEIEDKDNIRLSLFLYQVLENVHLKNQLMQLKSPTTMEFPPIALDLYYMLTSYPSGIQDMTDDRTKEEHRILGIAIQTLYDNSILSINNDELHIMLNPISLDDMTKMWTTFPGKPFRSSVCFLVTPVFIDSKREYSVQRVVSKEIDFDIIIPTEVNK